MSAIECCIFGCNNWGSTKDSLGRLYCATHWGQDTSHLQKKCVVPGCPKVGMIQQGGTGTHFCMDHVWESDRRVAMDKVHGLAHPKEAAWDEQDDIRAHGLGILISKE